MLPSLTLLDEHLRVKRRTTLYETVEQMRAELATYLEVYNTQRPHRRRGMEETPSALFKADKPTLRWTRKAASTNEVKAAA